MNDAQLIESLGGPAKVARMLRYDTATGGIQRVHNWLRRGIPARVKLDYPEVFLRGLCSPPSEGPAMQPMQQERPDATHPVAVAPEEISHQTAVYAVRVDQQG